jgi:outer membrane lipopolysaccharide assembly protein LptE/RlpB
MVPGLNVQAIGMKLRDYQQISTRTLRMLLISIESRSELTRAVRANACCSGLFLAADMLAGYR